MPQTTTGAAPPSKTFVGRLNLTPEHGPVGTTVQVEGTGLPADQTLDLHWESYDARWHIEQRDGVDWNQFYGFKLSERVEPLLQVRTDAHGVFSARFQVPEDYGGVHDVYLMLEQRKLNKAGFRMDLSAEMSPSEGPVGTPIAFTVKGLNPAHPIEGWYQLYYDNALTGFVTALTTRGTARVEIPAAGRMGPHLIALEDASFGVPYLGLECSPYAYLKTFQLLFEVTPGEPVLPGRVQEQLQPEQPRPAPAMRAGTPQLWSDDFEVPVGSALTFFGRGFPQGGEIELRWYDITGDRVSEAQEGHFGTGFAEMPTSLGRTQADARGNFQWKAAPQSIQGGAHAVEAWHNRRCLAKTHVRLSKRAHPLRPKAGPIGTPIAVEVDGVSWTEHENLVAITYDNSLVGYACGNDLMGKVLAKLHASGEPGWHFIDVYPAFRTRRFSTGMDDPILEVPYLYQKPIVNWTDHPHGFHFRYAFEVQPVKESAK